MQKESAMKAAQFILEDRRGADFYRDEKLLSKYLEGALGYPKEKADETAKTIQEDRGGANYYENVEILAEFLSG